MSECKVCSVDKSGEDRCKNCKNYLDIKTGEVREDFCPSCLVVPLAIAGAGATGVAVTSSGKNKMRKKVLLWSGVATVVLAVVIGCYYLMNKKTCLECKK